MKLHLKITLLVSIITLAVMTALMCLTSARLVETLRDEEKMRAEVEATNLAEHYGCWSSETEETRQVAALMQESRLEQGNVHLWKRYGDKLLQTAITQSRQREVPEEAATQLFRRQIARIERNVVIENNNFNYRVFVPLMRENQVVGAVEVRKQLNTLPMVLKRYLGTSVFLMLFAVGLIALTTYFLFRKLLYHPLEQLLAVIARAKQGELQAQVLVHRPDEIGTLTQEFNGMLGQIYTMASECEQQRLYLRERVRAATAELREHNEKLEATNLELWHTTRRLTQLERLAAAGQTATQFAHEVGTPLNVISCHAQLMQAELCVDPVAAAERTLVILEQTERIEQIVREMMDRTRAESTEFALLDLNALVKGLADATAPSLTKRGVNLELSLAPSLPPIEGDAEKLQQVFLNLINNSLDAMTEGGQLTISTRHEIAPAGSATTSHVSATLVDTGCGMTPEVKARLFDPLSARKAVNQGSGFGLVIVNQVMQEHRAQILVESAPQQGACFTLLFSSAKGQPA